VQEYIDKVMDERRDFLLKFRDLILKLYPRAEDKISFRIIMFKQGKGWVGLGYGKHGATVYTQCIARIAQFHTKFPKIKTGKGCINFKLKDDIPWDELEDVIHVAMGYKGC
jgi:uncharacterized protein YdhG (YjbR/CyaY superfamily)